MWRAKGDGHDNAPDESSEPTAAPPPLRLDKKFYWRLNYKEKAVAVRLESPSKAATRIRRGGNVSIFDDYVLPTKVAFYTRSDELDMIVRQQYSMNASDINQPSLKQDKVELEMTRLGVDCALTASWNFLIEYLKECNFKWTTNPCRWDAKIEPEMEDDDPLTDKMCAEIRQGLMEDMANGAAKDLLSAVVSKVEKMLGIRDQNLIGHAPPVNGSWMSGLIEYMAPGNPDWDAAYKHDDKMSSASSSTGIQSMVSSFDSLSMSSLPKFFTKKGRLVPDYVIYLPVPGNFLLNFECKQSQDSFLAAIVQCSRQMLTQMHFQSHAMGIVLSPLKWCLVLMIKEESTNSIKFKMYEESLIDGELFRIEGLVSLMNWIYKIVASKVRTYC